LPLTLLLGREQELAEVCALLRRAEVRLLTLTGVGGVGKTRLALEAARVLQADFPEGIWFVPLAPVSNPDRVIPTIAQTLGLWEAEDRPLLEHLQTYLGNRHLLLVLDNFEQILSAAPALAALLAFCPALHLLVTSRAVLHLSGEYEFAVQPLPVPDLAHLPDQQRLAEVATVALFLQRTQAIQPSFTLTPANAPTIAEICARLEGLPLAVELAAARIKLLPPTALLTRLAHRLAVLKGGARDLPVRQQTLRQTIQWSYDLLSPPEQRLFRWLSVFVSGCTLEAAAAVCNTPGDLGIDILEGVASLIDKSLLQQIARDGQEPRLLLLETLREYGLELLEAEGELEAARRAHAAYYLKLVEEAQPYLIRPEQVIWLDRLERDAENLRAVLHWAETLGPEEVTLALRLLLTSDHFWLRRGHLREAVTSLERLLAHSADVEEPLYAKALVSAGWGAWFLGNPQRAEALAERGLAVYQHLSDAWGIGFARFVLGSAALGQRDYARARPLLEEAQVLLSAQGATFESSYCLMNLGRLALGEGDLNRAAQALEESLAQVRAVGETSTIAWSLLLLARVILQQGGPARAQQLLEESLTLYREVRHTWGLAYTLAFLGQLRFLQGAAVSAAPLLRESVECSRAVGDRHSTARCLLLLGHLAASQEAYSEARAYYEASLAHAREVQLTGCIASALKGLGVVAAGQGQWLQATRLWGAIEQLRESRGLEVPSTLYERHLAQVHRQLGEARFAQALSEGRTLTPEQALAKEEAPAMTDVPSSQAPSVSSAKSSPVYPAGLTAREVEILRLVAQGLTDAQVAERLVISPRTVSWHLTSIYSKLAVSSRAAATRYAIEQHLA
jgi:predicted ATPase/DNA-binding CsgD family transcriptional regulator